MRITLDESDFKHSSPKKKVPIKKVKGRKKEKENIKKEKKDINYKRILLYFSLILLISGLGYLGYFLYRAYRMGTDIGLVLRPQDIVSRDVATLKKDSTGRYTSALIAGIDTREDMRLENTDTIILVSYNHHTAEVTMLSIPRDFHVEIDPGTFRYRRINSVYKEYEHREENLGLKQLSNVVTQVTGIEIQYYAMFNYNGFIELIDSIGGIDVYVENTFTDYRYPAPDGGRQTIRFEKGPQHMDGDTALKYSRSRLSLQAGEGSDFARARRQQNVITAVKEKILSETVLDPRSLMNLFTVVQDNVKMSEFTIKDIEAGIEVLKDYRERGSNYSFVLDPNAGGGNLVTSRNVMNNGAYAIGPVAGLGQYEEIHSFVQNILRNPTLYQEDPVVRVYNTGIGYNEALERYNEIKERFPHMRIYYQGTLRSNQEGVIAYINTDDEELSYSFKFFESFLKPDSTEKPDFITSHLNREDITILLGKKITQEEVVLE